jgi:hypothetical protein
MRNTYTPLHAHTTRMGLRPLTVADAQERLAQVEGERTWYTGIPPQALELTALDGNTIAIDGIPATSHAFNSVKGFVGQTNSPTPTGGGDVDFRKKLAMAETCGRTTAALQAWKTPRTLALRVCQRRNLVLGVVTDKYQHLPYTQLLTNIPQDWIVPRLTIDNGFCEVNVAHPDANADSLVFGGRIITSDVALCRATFLSQAMKLVCANGMIGVGELEVIKRFHLVGWQDDAIQMEWDERTRMFVANFANSVHVNRQQLSLAAKTITTVEEATAMLTALGLNAMRTKAALVYAEQNYPLPLNRYSVGQGVTYVSQMTTRENQRMASARDTIRYDFLATQYMGMAA